MQDIKLQIAEYGKGLSTNDYTEEAKAKVDAIPDTPKYTDTVYTHPSTHPASMFTQDAQNRMVSDAQINAWNGKLDSSGGDIVRRWLSGVRIRERKGRFLREPPFFCVHFQKPGKIWNDAWAEF